MSDINGLIRAANEGHTETVNRLLAIDAIMAQATSFDNYALRLAAWNGHTEIVNRLLEIDAVVKQAAADDNAALRAAARKGHTETVKILLIRGYMVPDLNRRHMI